MKTWISKFLKTRYGKWILALVLATGGVTTFQMLSTSLMHSVNQAVNEAVEEFEETEIVKNTDKAIENVSDVVKEKLSLKS